MLVTQIHQMESINIDELAKFTFDAIQKRSATFTRTLESIRSALQNDCTPKSYCCIARQDNTLVGWMFLFHYTESMIYIKSWHPVVTVGPEEDMIAKALIEESIRYAQESGKDRLEVFLMNLTDERRPLYATFQRWYESAGMPRGGEWAHMEVSLAEMEIPDVEFSEGYSVVPIKDVPNEEIWPCYYETFMASGDGRFLDQTDAQRKENFEEFFDKSRPRDEMASIIIKNDERIVGYNQVIMYGEDGYFNGIGIHPEFRGKGLGKKMILKSMKRSADNGTPKLILEVDINNRVAFNMYEKVGFKQTKGSISHVWKRTD